VNDSPGGSLVHGLLDAAAADAAGSSAVRDHTGVWTYAELAAWSRAVAAVLARRGVGRTDRVVVQLPTDRALVALFYGTSRLGAVFVPINPAMKKFHFDSVVANAEPVLVVTAADFGPLWSEVEEAFHNEESAANDVYEDDIAVLVYTSGSTAAPKGVIGPHRQVTFATHAIQAVLGYRRDDVVFCRFPMSWDYGLYKVLLSTLGRSEIVLADAESDLRLLKRMREVGATIVPIVPSLATMIAKLAERETETPAPVRLFTNTGAALPDATIAQLRKAFPGTKVVRQFGQTECKRITIMPPEEDDQRPGASGLPLPGTSVLILAADGSELPAGDIGEIVATGPHVMPGYWRTPEVSARAFRRDEKSGELHLHTGDYGRLDADGYLYFEGRRDDMFKRKGIRMSTLEIEAAAMDIPGVRAAGAIPPSETRDLAICVETELAPTTVLRELAKRLEPQKVPSLCHVVEEFPLTAHGKNATKELALLVEGARK